MRSHFDLWTKGRDIRSVGTNAGAAELPFQNWRRFKEAFTPELIQQAIRQSSIPVRRCLDPFGGSGTTALACQFLGVHPVTIEVNPFLADLIEAKLCSYEPDNIARDLNKVIRHSRTSRRAATTLFATAPRTFLEPGIDDRWIFDRTVGDRLARLLDAIAAVGNETHKRLFRVLVGGILIDVSNVIVSGKGRRYRRRKPGHVTEEQVDVSFRNAVRRAIADIHEFSRRPKRSYDLIRGDSRNALSTAGAFDLAVFSPPYPNSFDYTDVYNVELWTLGYLRNQDDNRKLRNSTLSSHVQIARVFPEPPRSSPSLNVALKQLKRVRADLWNRWIPEMVGGYFSDLLSVLRAIADGLSPRGSIWMVVGDSRYGGIHIPSSNILSELADSVGLSVDTVSAFRSMRASAQQGGQRQLAESLLVLSER